MEMNIFQHINIVTYSYVYILPLEIHMLHNYTINQIKVDIFICIFIKYEEVICQQ